MRKRVGGLNKAIVTYLNNSFHLALHFSALRRVFFMAAGLPVYVYMCVCGCVYMYIYFYTYINTYIHTYIYNRPRVNPGPEDASKQTLLVPQLGLYKIFFHLFLGMHESVISLSPPPICITHTTAILSRDFCAIYDLPPTLSVEAIHHTILVITISCQGSTPADQGGPLPRRYRSVLFQATKSTTVEAVPAHPYRYRLVVYATGIVFVCSQTIQSVIGAAVARRRGALTPAGILRLCVCKLENRSGLVVPG